MSSCSVARSPFGSLALQRCFVYPATRNNHETMLITLDTPMFLAEATSVAPVAPCWHSRDKRNQSGYVLALAGRCAR
jgi:hypothetical protein